LVLTTNEEQRMAQSLAATIEQSCEKVADVVALVHHASALFTALRYNNVFFNNALKCPAVFLSGGLLLPTVLSSHAALDKDSFLWKHWHGQSADFLKGAEYHIGEGAYNAALFCLHQSAECALTAVIRGVLGYNINNHNLSRLIAITQMFTADISGVFATANEQDLSLFNVLKNAYVNVRYKDSYQAKGEEVSDLFSFANKLTMVVEQVYLRYKLVNSL
jgi:HEPN domain-containing protein